MKPGLKPLPLEERLLPKIEPTGFCWLWKAGKNKAGYGKFKLDGVSQLAHRVVYEWLMGPVPGGLPLDHLCRVRRCVNPDHLEPVTHAENTRRGFGKGSQTHCPQGHEFTPENTFIEKIQGGRYRARRCRICHNAKVRKYEAKRKAAA